MAADDHIRTQGLDAVKAKLSTSDAFKGGWLAPRPPITPEECPAFTVMQGEEPIDYFGGVARFQNRDFTIHVNLIDVLDPSSIVDGKIVRDLNKLAVVVERLMVPVTKDGLGLGLGETNIVLVKTEVPQLSEQGSKPMGELSLTYRIVFQTVEGKPTATLSNAD